jgi:diguanylate cyclase (GGDEF)-like protein
MLTAAADLEPRRRRAVLSAVGVTASAWIAYALYIATGADAGATVNGLVTTWLFSGLVMAAALICTLRAVWVAEQRWSFAVLGLGMFCWSAGSIAWALLFQDQAEPPYPSIADLLYLLFYPCAYVSLMLNARSRVKGFVASVWLDGLIGVLAIAAVGAAVVVPQVADTTGGSLAVVATNLAYPLGDVLLIALIAAMFALTGWRPGRAWLLVGAGVIALAVADVLYLYRVANNTFSEGTLLDAIWPAGMVLLAVAAWQRGPRADGDGREFEGWAVLIAPWLFTLASVGVLVASEGRSANTFARVFAAGTIVAVLVRMAVAFNELRGLAETRRQAATDELTGLANRRGLYEQMNRALESATNAGEPMSLLVADLDGFKELNDTLGHQAGDLLLTQLGPRLLPLLDEGATLARLGGDEFAVLLQLDTSGAVEVAESIQRALEEPFPVRQLSIHIEASLGIASYPEHADNVEMLMQRADVAMYQAKIARTSYEVYAPDRDIHSVDRLALLGDLRRAIDSDELILHYQPKGDIETGRVHGVEALVRWQHPDRGLLSPADFIPAAEQTALMRPLTLAVLNKAIRQCKEWHDEGMDLSVAVNLAVPNLLDLRLPEDIAWLLAKYRFPPRKLQLELTENIVMADPPRVLMVLNRLKDLGVGLSLDDFGTGSASLAYIKQLPIDELKIDRSFVMNMETEHTDAVIVRSTTELGQRLGLNVVAEGVESAEAWKTLSGYGCTTGQGYWLLKPVDADILRDFVLRNNGVHAVDALTRGRNGAATTVRPS